MSVAHARLVDSLLQHKPSFDELHANLRPIRRDSASLEYLRRRARITGNCSAEAYANDLLGKRLRNASLFDAALSYHDAAIRIAQRCTDTTLIATALNGKGVVYRRQDLVVEAITAHGAALEIAELVKYPTPGLSYAIGVALNSMGNIYLAMERLDEAEEMFIRSKILQDSLDNPLGVAINDQNLGYVAVERKMYDTALHYFESSLVTNTAIASDFGMMLNYIAIADVYAQTGRAQEAYSIMQRTMPIVEEMGDPYHEAQALTVLGDVQLRLGMLSQGRTAILKALDVAADKDLLSYRVEAYELLARADSLVGDYQSALANIYKGRVVEQQLRSEKNQRYLGGLSAKLESTRQRAEIDRLAQENELVRERSRRDRLLLIAVIAGVVFLAGLLFILYRQRAIIDDRDMAHLEQQRLASQMNPHFLFNALNSIKAFLIDNDRDAAIHYLNTFARLVRRILNSSINETVTLQEELENCKLYIRIENARLNNEVDFNLTVDPAVDLDFWRIPPLLLQPFLENSFWHGLQTKPGNKHLELAVEANGDNRLRIIIADNGVGRAAAERANANRLMKRQSVGIDITRRRLQHYAKETGLRANFKTLDLVASDGEALGTEVVVEIG